MGKRRKNLTSGNIRKQLMQLTWPMLMGMMGMVIFNLVDTFFVGKLGVHQLAAMSFSFPVVMFLNSLSQGVGIGTSSLVSRNIIHTERNKVRLLASHALLLGFIIVVTFVIIGLLTIRPIFIALGARDEVLTYVSDYMRVWYFGVPFVVFPMIGNNIVRATGDTFTPGMIMVAIAIINAILDPFLIFGIGPFPELGIQGAALATVCARFMSFVAVLIILIGREKLLTFRLGNIQGILASWKKVLYIAAPASLTRLITPLSIGFITKILAGYGKEAVAAFGVASRIEMFVLMVIMALGSVLIIFVGQNFSKGKFDRIKTAFGHSFKFAMLWGLLLYLILLFTGRGVASLFTDNQTVIEIARKYFIVIGASYGFQGIGLLTASSLNGLNKPLPSAFLSIMRMLVLYVPLAWVGSYFFRINGVFFAGFVANIVVGILSYRFLFGTVKKMEAGN